LVNIIGPPSNRMGYFST